MSWTLKLGHSSNKENSLEKVITYTITIVGTTPNEFSVLDPVIEFVYDGDVSDVLACNMAEIPVLNRTYFITDITIIQHHMYRLSLHVDICSSYNNVIKNGYGYATHNLGTIPPITGALNLGDFDDGNILLGVSNSTTIYTADEPTFAKVSGGELDAINGRYILVTSGGSDNNLYSVYALTRPQLGELSNLLWSDDFITNLTKLFQNPIDAIISLHYIPLAVNGISEIVKIGNYTTEITAQRLPSRYGSVTTQIHIPNLTTYPRYEFLAYPPYTTLKLYLPYIGYVDMDYSDFTHDRYFSSGYLYVKYTVDFLTGDLVCKVSTEDSSLDNKHLMQYRGNCMVNLPITSQNYRSAIESSIAAIGVTAGVVASGVATGGIGLAAGGAVAGAVTNAAVNSAPDISNKGSFSGSSGVMNDNYVAFLKKTPDILNDISPTNTYDCKVPYNRKARGYGEDTFNNVTFDTIGKVYSSYYISKPSGMLSQEMDELLTIATTSGFVK